MNIIKKMKTEEDLVSYLDKLDHLCRICLRDNVKNTLPSPLNQNWEAVYQKIFVCTHVEFLNNETLPTGICGECFKELEVADQFRMKCENANGILRNIYQQYFVNDKQKKTTTNEDQLKQMADETFYDSDDEPLIKSDFTYSETFPEDNKDDIKDIITEVNSNIIDISKKAKKRKKTASKKQKNKSGDAKIESGSLILDAIIKTENEASDVIENLNKSFDIEDNTKLFICDICRRPLKDKRSLIRHITVQHSPEKMKDQMFRVTGYGTERRFHCSDCPHSTKRKIDMKIHSRVHSGHRPYVCDICSRSFTQYGTLAGHKKTHSDMKYFTCQECGKQFKYRETLKSHQRVHSNEYNFICQLCNKGLKTEKSLTFHMKRHYRIKNHNCELCGATFVTRAELTKHKYCHENKKRFYCTQCDYSSHWRHSLEIHTRRHLKDKSVMCDQCDYACYTKVELKLHKRKHSKEQHYPCPMCDEKFKQSTSVNKHMLSKHGQKFLWGNVADRRFIK